MVEVDPREVERALARLPGVAEVAVDVAPGDSPRLRLAVRAEADAAAVGRAVRRLLRDRFGLDVDAAALDRATGGRPPGPDSEPPRLTVVPRPDPTETPEPPGVPQFRPRATRLRVGPAPAGVRAEVTVAVGPREATGTAEGPPTIEGIRYAVAEAAARALATVRGDVVAAQVEDVAVHDRDQVRLALARLSGADPDGHPRAGAAVIGDDVRLAVIRAVLDAAARDEPPNWWSRSLARSGDVGITP